MKKHPTQRLWNSCILMLFLTVFAPLSLLAQAGSVTGVITDSNNEPVFGATVMVKNTNTGVVTDLKGEYSIQAAPNATLVISCVGLLTQEVAVGGRTRIDVSMKVNNTTLQDVVVVGYGTQSKALVTGSVSGVDGDEMVMTVNENPLNMLTGKIAGVNVWQQSAEPGTYRATYNIRGFQDGGGNNNSPLVVIDGIPRGLDDFMRLNPTDIEDVSVLKDATAAIYGLRSANGVILVTTKKGKQGQASVTYNGSFTFQKPSGFPTLVGALDAMKLWNERAMNTTSLTPTPVYTEEFMDKFRDGTMTETDWTSLVFSNFSPETKHDLTISGGNDKTQYYVGMGYFYQEGFFKSGDLNYNKFNVRSTITTEIAKGLKYNLKISGSADERNNPYSSSIDIIRNYWKQGMLSPAYADPGRTMLSYEGLDLQLNSIAMMSSDISGYRKYQQRRFESSTGLEFDLGTITPVLKGLTAKGMASFDYQMDNNTINRKEYTQYSYDPDNDAYTSIVFAGSSPNQLRRELYTSQQKLGQLLLSYDRTFENIHKVSGLVGWECQRQSGDNFYAMRNLAYASDYLIAGEVTDQVGAMSGGSGDLYDYAYESIFGRFNYSYDNRYLLEAQFRYDGSSKFAPGHQWGFFPSVSAGWRISEEPLFKSVSALSFVNQLKLRASYGVLADDRSFDYQWMAGYLYGSRGDNWEKGNYNKYAPGYMIGGKYVGAANPTSLPNTDLTWFTSHTFDVGVDFEGWNGLFGFTFDYYKREREGLLARRGGDLPTIVGATPPLENLNSDSDFGLELTLTHRNKIGDFNYGVKAITSVNRRKYITAVEKGPYGNSYDKWRHDNLNNRYQGVQFGYESAGRYKDWNDIWTYPIYKELNTLPGDYKYMDWNGDGQIDGLDEHPYAYDQIPWFNYSLSFDCSWKNLDFYMLWQGTAMGSMQYNEPLYAIWGSNGGGTLEQYMDRWHPKDPYADIYDPETKWISGYYGYTGHSPKGNSEFNRVSTAYLRLKSIEVGYTLPKVNAIPTMKLRVFANAYNLLTITGVKFVDPEHPDSDDGRLYPLNKTFTMGVSLTF